MAEGDHVERFRGCLALTVALGSPLGEQVRSMVGAAHESERFALARLISPDAWHVTLVTKEERLALAPAAIDEATRQLPTKVFPIGVGADSNYPAVLFVVCVWPQGRVFRAKHGLPPKDFHITLSVEDNHSIDKSYSALVDPDCISRLEEDALRAMSRQLLLESKPRDALRVAIMLCKRSQYSSARGWQRLADAAFATDMFKLAMLSYARAIKSSREEKLEPAVERQCVGGMRACSTHTEYGLVFGDGELNQVPVGLREKLCRPWSVRLLSNDDRSSEDLLTHSTASREQLYTLDWSPLLAKPVEFKLPRFFSWVVPLHLAAMSTPRNADDVRVLCEALGIRHIVTLTAESPLPSDWLQGLHCVKNTLLKVDNYCPPTPTQIDMFIRLCCSTPAESNTPVLVHCGGGKGRAGTMLACYLVAFGFRQPPPMALDPEHDYSPAMSAADAIQVLRSIRPGSIETQEQEKAVHAYCSLLWKRRSVLPRTLSEPSGTLPEIVGKPISTTDFLLLCGLPGSGKSSFTRALVKRTNACVSNPRRRQNEAAWTEVDSDASNRSGCERIVSQGAQGKLVLDRCNGERSDREWFLRLAASWSSHATAVWFDLPSELCEARAMQRVDHPSLPPGPRVRRAVAHHSKSFTPPELSEGFQSVVHVTSVDAALALVDMLSPPLPLMKFPRTPHLIDLGGATEDDIVSIRSNTESNSEGSADVKWPEWLVPSNTSVVVTEKLDGANLGISLSPHSRAFVVQNRSHYVNSSSHRQFQSLDMFLDRHREALFAVLNRDPLFPGRFVLYGEWLAATHSIPYISLQSLFYAFDLYDRETQQFWDRRSLELLLDACGADFPLAPVVYTGPTLPPQPVLLAMLDRDSPFCNGRGEGVYLKWERDGRVVDRSKVVRGDFIAGNEHWTRGELRFNGIASDTWLHL
jgi:atypical dual specificity phosphatase